MLLHGVLQVRVRVVVDVVGQHRPDLPGVLVGDGGDDLAEGHAAGERANPELLGRGVRALRAQAVMPDPAGGAYLVEQPRRGYGTLARWCSSPGYRP